MRQILGCLIALVAIGFGFSSTAMADDVVAEISFPNGEKPTIPKNQKADVVASVTFKDGTVSEFHVGDLQTYWKVKGQALILMAKPKAEAYGFGVVSKKKSIEVGIKVADGDFELKDSQLLDFDGKNAVKVQVKK